MRILLLAVLSLIPFLANAYEIEVNVPIAQVEAEMKLAKYAPTSLQVNKPTDKRIDYWIVDEGILHVVSSLKTLKVTDVWFEILDMRPKSEQRDVYLAVKRFDTTTGEMLIQTKRK